MRTLTKLTLSFSVACAVFVACKDSSTPNGNKCTSNADCVSGYCNNVGACDTPPAPCKTPDVSGNIADCFDGPVERCDVVTHQGAYCKCVCNFSFDTCDVQTGRCVPSDAGEDSPFCSLAATADILVVNPGGLAGGGPGAWVTIAAVGLDPSAAGNKVSFNGVDAPLLDFTPATATTAGTIHVLVPETATTGPLSVSTCAGKSPQSITFTVASTHAPSIASIAPTSGPPYKPLTFTGSHFTGAKNCILFGKTSTFMQPLTVTSDTQASCTVNDSSVGDVDGVGIDGAAGVGIGYGSGITFTVTQ